MSVKLRVFSLRDAERDTGDYLYILEKMADAEARWPGFESRLCYEGCVTLGKLPTLSVY